MSNAFAEALAVVLEDEGGFVNNALDRGGPTNYGITLKTFERFCGRKATIEDIRSLELDDVAKIYRELFWDALLLDKFPAKLACIVFNQAVLRGGHATVKTLQQALGVAVDGVIGNETIKAAKAANERRVIFDFLQLSHDAYLRIIYHSPDQAAFIRGWSARVFKLLHYAAFSE